MDAKVTWKKNMAFEAVADSGKSIMLDSDSDPAERLGPGPMELIADGHGGMHRHGCRLHPGEEETGCDQL